MRKELMAEEGQLRLDEYAAITPTVPWDKLCSLQNEAIQGGDGEEKREKEITADKGNEMPRGE